MKPALFVLVSALFVFSCSGPAQSPAAPCAPLVRHGRTAEAGVCFEKLTRSGDPYLRAEGFWGLEDYERANNLFRAAVDASPGNADYRVRWGRLFLERFNAAEAAKLFGEALELRKDHPAALLGLAAVAAEQYERKAAELAAKAASLDPNLVQARELLARLALEDGDPARAAAEVDQALKVSPEALDALAVRASIEWLADRPADEWLARIAKVNPVYGEAWATGGHFLVLNRRYEEGIRLYRKAVEVSPRLWKAREQLGVNLMRLGREAEARRALEECYQAGYKSYAVVNTLRLMDSYRNFQTIRTQRIVLKLHNKEAEVLKLYFQPELERAIATFEAKYGIRLESPVQLEVYPDHEDFAVRTLGMPGLGALGVTFGNVVAMDSPSARRPGSFHWASTLWHELSHVFVLSATGHRVPRWFTEGMAVHEETAVSPEWGDRLDPPVIEAIRGGKLLPVARLDRGFVRPETPEQVVISYFQAGRICDYIAGKWGYARLLEMMRDFGEMRTTPQVIERRLGMKPEEFDEQFRAWLESRTGAVVRAFDDWKKRAQALGADAKAGLHDKVIQSGPAVRDLYPEYVESGSVYEMLAEARLAKGDRAGAASELERYAKAGGRSPELLKRLAGLQEEAGRKRDAALTLARVNLVYPIGDEELHRRLGGLLLEGGDAAGAVREFQAAVAMKPLDEAASRYNLARAFRAANRRAEAREQVLLALESAPGYRPAQKLLLELSQ